MLVYMGWESLDIREEPWLGWIIADTQQTAEGGGYVALVDHEDGIITIQRLTSPPHNEAQPLQENNQQWTLTDVDGCHDADREP